MRAVLYARVSTAKNTCRSCGHVFLSADDDPACPKCESLEIERSQDTRNQLNQLELACRTSKWPVIVYYVDRVSGKSGDREQFQKMFEYLEAQSKKMRGKTDLVLYFWSLDRLSREGVLPTLQYLDRLNRLGVAWKSHTEPYLSSLGPFSDAVIAILATLAKQQRLQIVERTKAGLQRAQVDGTRSGKAIGRPRVEFDVEEARSLVSAHGIREAARMLGVKYGTLYLRLNGRKAPKKAISWSDPVWGTVIDGLFVEQDGGEIVIRYDAEGTAWCINHQVKLAECLERHGGA